MSLPERLTVPTCYGCGAMSLAGTCETGCVERRLDLVRGDAHGAVSAIVVQAERRSAVLAAALAPVMESMRSESAAERSLRAVQAAGRVALRDHPPNPAEERELAEPAEPVTTWWCESCHGLDAPQDCLAICIWKPVEWVRADLYDDALGRARRAVEREAALRALLRRAVHVTPRPGRWRTTCSALRREVRPLLSDGGR